MPITLESEKALNHKEKLFALLTVKSLQQSNIDKEWTRPVARGGSGGSDEPPVVAVKKILSFTAPAVTEAVL